MRKMPVPSKSAIKPDKPKAPKQYQSESHNYDSARPKKPVLSRYSK